VLAPLLLAPQACKHPAALLLLLLLLSETLLLLLLLHSGSACKFPS
jgi:hypothetical protein